VSQTVTGQNGRRATSRATSLDLPRQRDPVALGGKSGQSRRNLAVTAFDRVHVTQRSRLRGVPQATLQVGHRGSREAAMVDPVCRRSWKDRVSPTLVRARTNAWWCVPLEPPVQLTGIVMACRHLTGTDANCGC